MRKEGMIVVTKKLFPILFVCIVLLLPCAAFATSGLDEGMPPEGGPTGDPVRYIDDVGLLSDDEARTLIERLDYISGAFGFDTVVVVINNLNGWKADHYAAEVYEAWGFGMDSQNSGVVLLLAMADRDWGLATTGRGMDIFTESRREKLMDGVVGYLGNGDFLGGFLAYADAVEKYILKYSADGPVDSGYDRDLSTAEKMSLWKGEIAASIVWSLIFALIIALIVNGVLRRQLKSVRPHDFAREYIRSGSMVLRGHLDRFLYRNVTRTAKPKDSGGSSGGGGGFHSSSGGSWSGSSGKF